MTRLSSLTSRNALIAAHDALATALALFASFYVRFEGNEYFYARVPLLLLSTPKRRRILMLGIVIVISICFRIIMQANTTTSYYGALLPVPMEYLAWGGIFAALMVDGRLNWLPPFPTAAVCAAGVIILAFFEYYYGFHGLAQFRPSNFQTPEAFLLGLFIWSLWNLPGPNVSRRFARKPVFSAPSGRWRERAALANQLHLRESEHDHDR